MWIMTKLGFFSVVENRDNKDAVLIRARAREDLENLSAFVAEMDDIPGFDVADIDGPDKMADYRWRLWVRKDDWREVIGALTDDIDYANFKTAVGEVNKSRASTYMRVWSTLLSVQIDERNANGEPYQSAWPKFWDDGDDLDAAELPDLPRDCSLTDDEVYAEFFDSGGREEDDGRDA